MINVKEIRASKTVLGKYAQHLVTHPKDMIQLIKEDVNLAHEYANIFTAEQVHLMFTVAQEQKMKLANEISLIQVDRRAFNAAALSLPAIDFAAQLKAKDPDSLETMMEYIRENGKVYTRRNDYDGKDYMADGMLLWSTDWGHEEYTLERENIVKMYNKLKNAEVMPQRIAEESRKHASESAVLNQRVFEIIITLTEKISRNPLLDFEFVNKISDNHSTFFSRVFSYRPAESQVLERIVKSKRNNLISKTLMYLTPPSALIELCRVNQAGGSCLKMVIDDLPHARPVIETLIRVMGELSQDYISVLMEHGNFDVLHALQEKAPDLAKAFFNAAPDAMKHLYPASASEMGEPRLKYTC